MSENDRGYRPPSEENMDGQPVVKEFIRPPRPPAPIKRKRRRRRRRRRGFWYYYGRWVVLGTFASVFTILLLCGVLLFELPILSLSLVMVLETILAICLYGKWIWLQVLVFLLGILVGILFQLVPIMLIGACIYAATAMGLYVLLLD